MALDSVLDPVEVWVVEASVSVVASMEEADFSVVVWVWDGAEDEVDSVEDEEGGDGKCQAVMDEEIDTDGGTG